MARGVTIRELGPTTWRRAAFSLFAVAAGTNVPTPLLLVYRDRLDLSPDVLTAVFGAYAAGLVPALFLAGPASDRLGRRRFVVVFSGLAALTSLLLVAAAGSLPLLFVGRCLQGAVSGAVFSVGSAWVAELSGPTAGQAAGRRAAVAMTGGFALGPLVSGVLAQYGPAPTTLPYLLHVVLVVGGLLVARRLPETVAPRQVAASGPLVEPHERRVLLTVLAPMSVCVYAFPTVVVSAVPLLVSTTAPPVLLTGVLAGLTLGSGTVAAPLQRRLGAWSGLTGVCSGAAGYALLTLGAASGSPPVLLVAAVLLGGGGGLVLAAGLGLLGRIARPERRGALSAVFYACAYVGFALPYVTAVSAQATRVQVPLAVECGLSVLLALRLLVATRRGDLRTTGQPARA